MLDSSPVALPPIPRPLKRSASTASLPTPPRSYRKSARGKSRGSCDSDSDGDSDRSDDKLLGQRHKKRRIGEEKQVDEDAFWLGGPAADLTPEAKSQPASKSNASTTLGSTNSPPVTPKTRSSTRRALRDSPDNPFLVTPENQVDDTPSHSDTSANPSPHEPLQERPTIAYVLYVSSPSSMYICIDHLFSRGVRRECKNPLYNHAQDRPFSPPPESKLAIDHPDYSPSIHCVPKRLFSEALSKKKKPSTASKKQEPLSRKRARQRSPSLSADEDDVGEIRPLKLDFGSKKRAGGPSSDQEL